MPVADINTLSVTDSLLPDRYTIAFTDCPLPEIKNLSGYGLNIARYIYFVVIDCTLPHKNTLAVKAGSLHDIYRFAVKDTPLHYK